MRLIRFGLKFLSALRWSSAGLSMRSEEKMLQRCSASLSTLVFKLCAKKRLNQHEIMKSLNMLEDHFTHFRIIAFIHAHSRHVDLNFFRSFWENFLFIDFFFLPADNTRNNKNEGKNLSIFLFLLLAFLLITTKRKKKTSFEQNKQTIRRKEKETLFCLRVNEHSGQGRAKQKFNFIDFVAG